MADNSLNNFYSFDKHRLLTSTLTSTNPEPRICVICVASYKQGRFYGEWIAADQPIEDIYEAINQMLINSPVTGATEWAIYTYEGFGLGGLKESDSIEMIYQKALYMKIYGGWGLKLFNYYNDDVFLTENAIVNNYQGEYSSELEFAQGILEKECNISIPEFLKPYIDYESFRKNIFRHDYFSIESEGEIHIFSRVH